MRNERNSQKPHTCFRCGLEDHFIAYFTKPDNSDKKVHWSTENHKTRVYRSTKIGKTSENSTNETESQKIYASMARMSTNAESPRRYYGYSLQLTNCILDSSATYLTTPEISVFVLGSLL